MAHLLAFSILRGNAPSMPPRCRYCPMLKCCTAPILYFRSLRTACQKTGQFRQQNVKLSATIDKYVNSMILWIITESSLKSE